MRRTRVYMALAACTFSTAAFAAPDPLSDSRQVASVPWDPEKITGLVMKICDIPRAYVSIQRDYDGYARVKSSPSVTADQHACVARIIDKWGVPVRK